MLALVTGASSGIGRDMARELSRRGYDLIITARRRDRLEELAEKLPTRVRVIEMDLSRADNCRRLHELTAEEPVDVLINNAGFGVFGAFEESDLERELEMLDINIRATHMLTKLYLRDFLRRGEGMILNVSSRAATEQLLRLQGLCPAAHRGHSRGAAAERQRRLHRCALPRTGENRIRPGGGGALQREGDGQRAGGPLCPGSDVPAADGDYPGRADEAGPADDAAAPPADAAAGRMASPGEKGAAVLTGAMK